MDYITTANVLTWVFVTLGFFLVFLSHWLVSVSLFPRYVDECAAQYRRPVTATLLGLLAMVIPIVIGLVILKASPPALKWIGLFVIGAPVMGGLMGTAGLAFRIGQGMPAPGDEAQPWKRVLRGGTALALTFLLPVLGQILAIPLILASGLGASLLTWSARRGRKSPAPAIPPLPSRLPS